jgi:hypothetical protein
MSSIITFIGIVILFWFLVGCQAPVDTVQGKTEFPSHSTDVPTATAFIFEVKDEPTEMVITPTEEENLYTFIISHGGTRRDRGINLLQTRDGGYAVVGYSNSGDAVGEDVLLVRLDRQGNVLWSKLYGGEGDDNGWDLLETDEGGFIVVGFTDSMGAGGMDIYLIRMDALGELIWERTYGGPQDEYGWSMTRTVDGGYVLGGQTESFGEGQEDGYLVKVDPKGDEIWSQTYGGGLEDRLFSVDQGADNGYVLAGTTRSFGKGERDLFLVKTDNAGMLSWMQVFGGKRDDVGHAVRQTADSGYIITGYTKSHGTANYDSWAVKTDIVGEIVWETFFGDFGDDRTIYGEQTWDGGYILTGYTRSFGEGNWDVFLVKLDAAGEVSWFKTFGGTHEDTGYTGHQTSDFGFVLTGETYSNGKGGGDMYIIKVNPNGELE